MIYLFNNNEEMIRIIPNSAIKRMYQTQKLTDENYISDRLDVEIQALNDEELSELEYMAIDDIENPQRFHYYFIAKETTEHQVTSLTGVQSGIEELRKTPVYDMRPTNLSPKLIADRLLEGTNWQAGYTTDDVGTISTNFYYTDVFSALKKMCVAFGIEMQFFVEITTNRIGARYIEFRKRTGKSVGKRVVYGHNALKIVKEVEKTNTVTALIGRGKGVHVSESDEGNIGYGRKIGFENVEWKKSSGAPVDKPLGQEFVEIPELTLQYGIKNSNGTVRPKIGFVEFQDEESETRLINRTYNALLELSRPQVLLETSSVYLPDTGIGDTINVVRHDRDLRYQTRVFEITWDRLANKAVDMRLGDRLGESENKRISRISSQVSGNISTELSSTIDELVDRVTSADGKNTNWYTDYDPMENPDTMGLVRVNDNWYQPDPEFEGEFILKQWNGEMWVEILRTSGNPELVRRFEEVEQQAEVLSKGIEASDQKADEAKETAGLAKSAVDAFGIIVQENSDKMVDVEQLVTDAESNASGALAKASEAVTQAGQAVVDAQTAMGNAQSALNKAGDAESTVSTLSSEFDELTGEVKLKADKSVVDTLSGTVSTHTTTLTQQATAIASKAEQTEVDTVKGTVSTHTSTLSQHAKDISARLTQTQVDNLVSGKGYSTISYVDTQMSATAEGIWTEMTAVEGKIPTEIGGTNLVPDSDLINHSRGITVCLHATLKPSSEGLEVKSTASSGTYGIRTQSFDVIGGQDYIISADIGSYYNVPFLNYIHIMYEDGLGNQRLDNLSIDSLNVTLKRYSLKFKADRAGRVNILFGKVIGAPSEGFRIRNIKLEKGSIASDWSPAPVDSLSNNDFTAFKNTYSSTISGITSELNKTAKKTDLNGMVTESYLATNQYTKQGEINTQLQSYLKTTDLEGKVQETTAFQNVKTATDRFTRVIGSTDSEAKANIAQIAMTDSLFQTTVRESVNIGGSNLIPNTDITIDTNLSKATAWSAGITVRRDLPPDNPQHFIYAGATNREIGYSVGFEFIKDIGFNIIKDQVYTLSFLAFSSVAITNPFNYIHIMRGSGDNQNLVVSLMDSKLTQVGIAYSSLPIYKHEYTFKANWSDTKAWLLIASRVKSNEVYQWIRVAQIQLEKGNIATDWSPSPLDTATTQQVSDIKQTANSIQALIGTTNDSVARAVMTSNLWETEVSKVIDEELEQEYKTVTSKVNVVDGGKNSKYGESYPGGRYFYFNSSDGFVQGTLNRNKTYTLAFSMQPGDNKGTTVILQVKHYGATSWDSLLTASTTAGTQVNTFTFKNDTFATSVIDYRLAIHNVDGKAVPYIWGFKLYEEVEVEVPITSSNTGAIGSKITQLYDMINLSILGQDGAMSRIAMGEEGIQIDGKLLHITAKTFIDDAVIKSAMIDTLDAGKITTGELNANLIRVVNLDASSISGNEANFIRAMFSGTKSTLQITGSGVNILDNEGRSSTYLDSSGIEFTRQGIALGKLEYVTNISDSGDLNNMNGFSMRPNRNSYFGISYFPTSGATESVRRFAVSGRTGNVYIHGLIKPSEQQVYGLNVTWGTVTGRSTNVEIWNHNKTGGIHIANGDLFYLTSNGTWRSLNDRLS